MRSDAVTTTLTFLTEKINTVEETDTFLDPSVCGCCYINRVFGHQTLTEITDPFKNDITRFLRGYETSIDTVSMFLTKPSDSNFIEVALIDDTFGQFFALGFHTGLGRNYIGYEINWRLVLITHGEGEYQIRADKTGVLPSIEPDFDFEYHLQNFTAERAETTIRLSFENSNMLRSRFDQKKRISFPDNWTNQIRVKGILKSLGSEYNKTFIKYKDESKRTIEDEQVPKYFMRIEQAPVVIHDFIRTEVMQADVRKVTDYNRNNPWKYEDIEIIEPSSYEPENESEVEQLMDVEIEFRDRYDTGLKKKC
jgi:hypothetical protein